MNELQALVSERMQQQGLSYRRAAARSDGRVSHSTLYAIAAGRHAWRLDDRTIEGIALAIDSDVATVRKAAGLSPATKPVEFVFPEKAYRLSPKSQRAVIALLETLLDAEERAEQHAWHGEDRPHGRRASDRRRRSS